MIVDTSALVAILKREPGFERILDAIGSEGGGLPAPAALEFMLVAGGAGKRREAGALLDACRDYGLVTLAFTPEHAAAAAQAAEIHGKGNGRGGVLNVIDLMVYAIALDRDEPLLCTGKDFASTGLKLHPASRPV